jgi:urease accessory protein UreH
MQDDEALKRADKLERFNIAVDPTGKLLPFLPDQVEQIVSEAIHRGTLIAAVFQLPTGELGVQVFGPPSEKLAALLEQAAHGYRQSLKHRD